VPALVPRPESSSITAVLRVSDPGAPDAPQNQDEELALRVYETLAGDPIRIRAFRRYLRKLTGQSS
jgi:hypothetical protein